MGEGKEEGGGGKENKIKRRVREIEEWQLT